MGDLTVVFTNDDAGNGDVALFAELLDFLKRRSMKGTFFTIPCAQGKPLGERPEWVAILQRAREEGHEIGLHGYVHDGFEFGRPPDFMLDLMGPKSWERLQGQRQALGESWRVEVLQGKIERGIAIFEQTLGFRPRSWRSPCAAVCTNLYLALSAAGIAVDSSLIVNPQGWPYANKDFTTRLDWELAHPPYPFRYHADIVELPLMSEYTWYLTDDAQVEHAWNLMVADGDRAVRASGLFTVMTHFYAMTGPYRKGLELYDRFFDYVESLGTVKYRTVTEAATASLGPWPISR